MTDNYANRASTNPALVIAVLWAFAALLIGLVFVLGTPDFTYGGDAYTGIQQSAAQTARAIGFLIISTGALGLIIATNRPAKEARPIAGPSGSTPSHMDEDGI